MPYQTTITPKGQITIPKEIREIFKLRPFQKIIIDFEKKKREIKLKPSQDFLEIIKKIKVKKKINVMRARKFFERHYARV